MTRSKLKDYVKRPTILAYLLESVGAARFGQIKLQENFTYGFYRSGTMKAPLIKRLLLNWLCRIHNHFELARYK